MKLLFYGEVPVDFARNLGHFAFLNFRLNNKIAKYCNNRLFSGTGGQIPLESILLLFAFIITIYYYNLLLKFNIILYYLILLQLK